MTARLISGLTSLDIFNLQIKPFMDGIKIEKQLTGISGEFFVAAELAKRNFQVSLTLGNAKGIDLYATNQITEKIFEIEVKTLRKKNCFTLNTQRLKLKKIFIFVFLNDEETAPDFYIVTGEELLKDTKHFYGSSLGTDRETVNHGPLIEHKNCWDKLN